MALINHATRELTAKIVYYGPGLSGKTSNLTYIYENMDEGERGQLLTLSTETDRTIFFDFLPLDVGEIRGVRVRVQLYTVPGQVFYEETRRQVLKGADGIVFVADSQRKMADANVLAFQQMRQHVAEQGIDLQDVPLVLQYNKRDIPDVLSLEEMDAALNPGSTPFFEAVATEGVGVEDTLKAISALVLRKILARPIESHPVKEDTLPGHPVVEIPPEAPADLFPAADTREAEVLQEGGLDLVFEDHSVDDSAELLFAGASGKASGGDALKDILDDSPFAVPPPEDTGPRPALQVEPEGADSQQGTEPPAIPVVEPGVPVEVILEVGGRRFALRISLTPLEEV
jgi:hypothetical protein